MALNKRKNTNKTAFVKPVVILVAKIKTESTETVDIDNLSRDSRLAKITSTSFDDLKELVDSSVKSHGGKVPTSCYSSEYRPQAIGAWDFSVAERDRLNAIVGWLHVNSPLELSYNRGYLRVNEPLIKRNLYMTEVVDFNWHLEGLWLQRYNQGQMRKSEVAKEKASNLHPIAQFVSEKKGGVASFADIKKEFPEMTHIHSYLHYLVNKKGVLSKEGTTYTYIGKEC
jgi:hypothetical protein